MKQCRSHSEKGLGAHTRERRAERVAHRQHARVGPGLVKGARRQLHERHSDGSGDDVVHRERAEGQRYRVGDVEPRKAADATPPARAEAQHVHATGNLGERTCSAAAVSARSTGPRAAAASTRHATAQRTASGAANRRARHCFHRTSRVDRLGRFAQTGVAARSARLRLRGAAERATRRSPCRRAAGRRAQHDGGACCGAATAPNAGRARTMARTGREGRLQWPIC